MSDGIEDKGRCSGVLSGDAGEEYPPGPGGKGRLLISLGPSCLAPAVELVVRSLAVEWDFSLCFLFSDNVSGLGRES